MSFHRKSLPTKKHIPADVAWLLYWEGTADDSLPRDPFPARRADPGGEGVAVPGLGLLAHRRGVAAGHPCDDGLRRPARTAQATRGRRPRRPRGSLPATCFPTASALGSSWDPELVARVGAALGAGGAGRRASRCCSGPGINIKRSPLCGRNFEYFSEDPRGLRRARRRLVAGRAGAGRRHLVKHFAANNQETDRLRVSADVDERTLREIYLPGFERVVTAGPAVDGDVLLQQGERHLRLRSTTGCSPRCCATSGVSTGWCVRLGRGARPGRRAGRRPGPGDAAEPRGRATPRSSPRCAPVSWTRRVLDGA